MKFLDSGYYNSQLGDLMPLAMANVLQAHVILLRTDTNIPWYITPDFDTHDKTIILVQQKTFQLSFNAIPFVLARNRTESACNVTELRTISRRLVQYRFVPCALAPQYLARNRNSASKENAFG